MKKFFLLCVLSLFTSLYAQGDNTLYSSNWNNVSSPNSTVLSRSNNTQDKLNPTLSQAKPYSLINNMM